MTEQTEYNQYQEVLDIHLRSSQLVIFSKTTCGFCTRAKEAIRKLNIESLVIELDHHNNGKELQEALYNRTGRLTVPSVWINKKCIGGCKETLELIQNETFLKKLNKQF
jgi:glutaredoxin 3